MMKQHGQSGKAFSSIMARSLGGKSEPFHSLPLSTSVCVGACLSVCVCVRGCVQAFLRGESTSQRALTLFWLMLLVPLCVLNTQAEPNIYYGSEPGQAFRRRAVHSRHEPRPNILLHHCVSSTRHMRPKWIWSVSAHHDNSTEDHRWRG